MSAWGQEASQCIPAHLMIAVQHHGGLVLSAFDGRKMVGVSFGISAYNRRNQRYHYSHITGVHKEHQSKGIGFKLKKAQRQQLLKQGIHLVKWTFDPLQARNAFFNIRKLGAICNTYHRNFYGDLQDSLNHGSITDRFELDWWIDSPRVLEKLDKTTSLKRNRKFPSSTMVNSTVRDNDDYRRPSKTFLNKNGPVLHVEIPVQIGKIRDINVKIANQWTYDVRRIFEHYFRRNYHVEDFTIQQINHESRAYYTMQRIVL